MVRVKSGLRLAKSHLNVTEESINTSTIGNAKETLLRRKPSQDRSKDRLEKILKAAEVCILHYGAANLKISDIANEAGMANSSIYQYFKSREQIIQALLERYLALFNRTNLKLLEEVSNEDEFLTYLENLAYDYQDYLKSNLAYQAIWMGSQGWNELREIDQQDNIRIARAWVNKLNTIRPDLDPERTFTTCLICIESGGHITRIAVTLGGKAERIMVEEMMKMIKEHLKLFLTNPS
jgi:AcrR family transcriptional regulator